MELRRRWPCTIRAALRGAWFGAKFAFLAAFVVAAIFFVVSLISGHLVSLIALLLMFIVFPIAFSLIGAGVAAVVCATATALASYPTSSSAIESIFATDTEPNAALLRTDDQRTALLSRLVRSANVEDQSPACGLSDPSSPRLS